MVQREKQSLFREDVCLGVFLSVNMVESELAEKRGSFLGPIFPA
jgi:hypothetical protein